MNKVLLVLLLAASCFATIHFRFEGNATDINYFIIDDNPPKKTYKPDMEMFKQKQHLWMVHYKQTGVKLESVEFQRIYGWLWQGQ